MDNLKINSYELEAVLKWIDNYDFIRPGKKMSRDFSDGVLMAEILKFEFPNLVELHNYQHCNGIKNKVDNWDTLNRKVLKKVGINLKQEEIEKLAKADENFVEEVLFGIMNKVKQAKALEQSSKDSEGENELQSDTMTVTVEKKVGDHVENVEQQMIPYAIYEELLDKFEEQQYMIGVLEEKVDNLTVEYDTKSLIIADLQERIEKMTERKNKSSLRKSIAKFF